MKKVIVFSLSKINNPTVRLINPAKNEIPRIRKVTLDKINSSLIEQFKVN